jgi:hypothetical protein
MAGKARTWRLDKVSKYAMEDIVIGPDLSVQDGPVEVIELEPVLDLLERSIKAKNLGPLADFLKAHRLESSRGE